jgi:hypothetical protein
MRTPPQDLTEADVGIAVAAHWSIVAETIEYAPVGFGSHHWVLTESAGRRWFVTGDAVVDSDQRLADLTAALKTAHALRHRCDLEFVSAPQVSDDGGLVSITGRYALALYPHLEQITDAPADPQQLLSMITASGPTLLDWDTVQLAPPARDLWMTGSVDSYVLSTGRHLPAEELECYRLRWDLKDLCGLRLVHRAAPTKCRHRAGLGRLHHNLPTFGERQPRSARIGSLDPSQLDPWRSPFSGLRQRG